MLYKDVETIAKGDEVFQCTAKARHKGRLNFEVEIVFRSWFVLEVYKQTICIGHFAEDGFPIEDDIISKTKFSKLMSTTKKGAIQKQHWKKEYHQAKNEAMVRALEKELESL